MNTYLDVDDGLLRLVLTYFVVVRVARLGHV